MSRVPREYTNKLLELVEEGLLDPTETLKSALCYISEADVEDLYEYMGLKEFEAETNGA